MPLQWSCDGTVAGVPFTQQGWYARILCYQRVKTYDKSKRFLYAKCGVKVGSC